MQQSIEVKYAPRHWSSHVRNTWFDSRPFVVLVDGKIAKDTRGNERRFGTREGAQKAFK